MSAFTKRHYKEIGEVIKDWIKLNPRMYSKSVDSLINGFIITFKADNSKFNRHEFEDVIGKEAKK